MAASLLVLSGKVTPVGSLLRRFRLARGLSLAQVAIAGKVSKSALARWEANRRRPEGSTLTGVLDVLGVPDRERAALLTAGDPKYARTALSEAPRGASAGPGEFVRAIRLRRRMSQERLAGVMGVGQSTVARWERGDLEMNRSTVESALASLGATPEECVAAASLDPAQRPALDLEERYQRIAKSPHSLGETLWIGLEADLWWRTTQCDRHDRMLQTVIGDRADWYALSMRPQETAPLARRAMRVGFGPPSDVPQGVAYGIVYSTIPMRVDPIPALNALAV